jgi:hypothetical protein
MRDKRAQIPNASCELTKVFSVELVCFSLKRIERFTVQNSRSREKLADTRCMGKIPELTLHLIRPSVLRMSPLLLYHNTHLPNIARSVNRSILFREKHTMHLVSANFSLLLEFCTYNLSKSKYSTSSASFCSREMGSLKVTSKEIVDMSYRTQTSIRCCRRGWPKAEHTFPTFFFNIPIKLGF